MKDPLQQKHTIQWIIESALLVCFHGGPDFPRIFHDLEALNGTPVTFELKVREQNRRLEYLNKANVWSKFHQNRPTNIFNLWNTFSDNDT